MEAPIHKSLAIFTALLIFLGACSPVEEVPPTPMPEIPHEGTLRVAYSRQADPWIWTEGEGSLRLADSVNVMEVALSSDGQVVAFKRDDTGEILTVNADGTGLHTVVDAAFLAGMDAMVWVFDFAPHSHKLFFTLQQAGSSYTPYYDLYTADAQATVPVITLLLAAGQGGIPTFSPDGQWMTVYHPGGLDLARVDGTDQRIIFPYPKGYEPATFGPGITWLQDSSGFVTYHIPDPSMDLTRGGLWFVPLAGEAEERIVTNSTWGVPSPDGQRLGYSTPGNPSEVNVVEMDGSDVIYLADRNAYFGGWSPDSQHFYIYVEEEKEGRLQTIPYLCSLGEAPIPLTDTEAASPVVWVTASEFLFASWGDLRLQHIGQASMELDSDIYNRFDYVLMTP